MAGGQQGTQTQRSGPPSWRVGALTYLLLQPGFGSTTTGTVSLPGGGHPGFIGGLLGGSI
jgi:hypothetical protein